MEEDRDDIKRAWRGRMLYLIKAGFALLLLGMGAYAVNGEDAYIAQKGSQWTFGTASVERTIALENGKLLLKSFRDKTTGFELALPGAGSEEFFLSPESGTAGPWKLISTRRKKLKDRALQLEITLRQASLEAKKSYVIYPESSIIREWVTFANKGDTPLKIVDPGFLAVGVRPGSLDSLDFHWMTGGENQPGSWMLKTESLATGQVRKFDSYDPFPGTSSGFPGEGIDAKILLNDKQVWPEEGWHYVPNAAVTVPFDVTIDIEKGDRLIFRVNMHGNIGWDTTAFDPAIAYEDGETHTASKEFGSRQGEHGWRYQYIENGQFVDLVYYPGPGQWRKEKDNQTGTPFVGRADQHPDQGQDAARVWTAPKSGKIRVTGSVCNTGNRPGSGSGFRMGCSSYAPWYALRSRATGQGLFIGWDYFGHWVSSFEPADDGSVTARLKVAGHRQTLNPGESVETPKAFVGLFRDDLDNAGNALLDWQYRYLWDYTREAWFPAVRMLGYWWNGTGWGKPGVGWTGGQPDYDSTFRKVFRVADLMRYVGGDVYHRDWGWWDRAGDWNGPDFRTTGEYLGKHGMGQLIYAFIYTVDMASRVAQEHPDWVLGGSTLDMSRPEVVAFLKSQLDSFAERWGNFEWRNDSTPTCPRNGDDTPLLGQDQGLREILRSFLDKHPGCAFQAVNGGGNNAGYDYVRYASSVQFSDGAVGIIRNYYASLLLPPDKTNDMPDIYNPDKFDKSTWRGLLCCNFDMTGDTRDPEKLEGLRELIDIYHYLKKQGVVGRWVRVYRPVVTGDDPTMYFQRLSRDGKRGIIIPKHTAPGPVAIRPKGLLPDESYFVSFQESEAREERTGSDLMAKGITLEKMLPGELIYLNLPLHPGSKLDTAPPAPPRQVQKRSAVNMGYPGVEITWKPSPDDNWRSYYQVFRNGIPLDRISKGTYCFDHSAGADINAVYGVCAVDGAGNASRMKETSGGAFPAFIFDDAPGAGIDYSGRWRHLSGLHPAYKSTVSLSDQKGAAAAITLTGKRILWFSKLGADCGKALVSVDGSAPETVDTYSADDIWGVCVWQKEFPARGTHTVRIEVAGEHSQRAKGNFVYVDGLRAEEE